jgi:hypothetical protein
MRCNACKSENIDEVTFTTGGPQRYTCRDCGEEWLVFGAAYAQSPEDVKARLQATVATDWRAEVWYAPPSHAEFSAMLSVMAGRATPEEAAIAQVVRERFGQFTPSEPALAVPPLDAEPHPYSMADAVDAFRWAAAFRERITLALEVEVRDRQTAERLAAAVVRALEEG